MNLLNKKAKEIIKEIVIKNYSKIKVNSGICRYNFKCHHNAVHDAINDKQDKIAMCFYIDNDYPIIHFINIDENGKYIDNTLGNWSSIYDYYLIKYIEKDKFFQVNDIFSEYRKELNEKLPFLVRILSNCDF